MEIMCSDWPLRRGVKWSNSYPKEDARTRIIKKIERALKDKIVTPPLQGLSSKKANVADIV